MNSNLTISAHKTAKAPAIAPRSFQLLTPEFCLPASNSYLDRARRVIAPETEPAGSPIRLYTTAGVGGAPQIPKQENLAEATTRHTGAVSLLPTATIYVRVGNWQQPCWRRQNPKTSSLCSVSDNEIAGFGISGAYGEWDCWAEGGWRSSNPETTALLPSDF